MLRRSLSQPMPFLVMAIGLWGGANAFAQQAASVVGMVTDESKALLPGVTVTATEVSSGRQYTAVADTRGEYRLVNIQPSTYRVQAELTGFSTVVLPNIELLVGQNATINFVLKVAGVAETLTVTGEAPLVDTRSTQVGGNIDRRQMEDLPIAGRNWLELSMLVKGVTANDVTVGRPGARDDLFQLNLDGQQVTQLVAASASFGQPGLSREAIAEYQIVTNLFDVTQGRSAGMQVQAISRSGTNNIDGSLYGYFRSDRFNSADHVAGIVLPFSNQQIGGSIGGPILLNRAHYFVTYEYEREPNTFVLRPPGYAQSIALDTKRTQHRTMARSDYQISQKDRLMVRYTDYRDVYPFGGFSGNEAAVFGQYPTDAAKLGRNTWALSGTWTRVLSTAAVQEVKAGYNYYHWNHTPAEGVPNTPRYNFPGQPIGGRFNYPQEFWQDSPSVRYDLSWHRGRHDFKFGSELIKDHHTGWWLNTARGQMEFSTAPADMEQRFPLDSWNDSSQWDLTRLDSTALFYNQFFAREGTGLPGVRKGKCPLPTGCGDWTLDIPRPVFAFWIGDTLRVGERLTLNLGIRYDVDWGAMAPPFVKETDLIIDNGLFTENVGYRNNIRDLNNWSPRVGFNYNVRGDGRLALRGGSGLYYGAPGSNTTFNQQLFNGQRVLANTFVNDGRPGFVLDPTRGVTSDDVVQGRVPLPPQAIQLFGHDYQLPTVATTMLGIQQQLDAVMAFDADLIYTQGWNLGSVRDPNLFYDPATGFNKHPTLVGRPRSDYGTIRLAESRGRSEGLDLATSFTRRYRNNFQAGLTYTLMFFRRDTGTSSSGTSSTALNPFDLTLNSDFGRAMDFQRHTLRLNVLYQLPADITLAGAYFHGSGNYFQSRYPWNPYGSNSFLAAGARLRPDGSLIPINDFQGDALHKLDLRLTKRVNLPGGVRLEGIAEVFNLLNHANYGSYNTTEARSTYGQPVRHLGTMYVPRSGQLAFRITF